MYAAAVLVAGPGSAALAAAGRGLVCGGWTRTSLYANPRNIQLGRGRAGRWVTAPPLTATLATPRYPHVKPNSLIFQFVSKNQD